MKALNYFIIITFGIFAIAFTVGAFCGHRHCIVLAITCAALVCAACLDNRRENRMEEEYWDEEYFDEED